MTKEDLINNIVISLTDVLGEDKAKKVKEIIVLEMRNINITEKETSLVVNTNEIAYAVQKFIACKKLAGCTSRTLEAYLKELSKFFNIIDKDIKDINVDDIRYYLAHARKNGAGEITVDNYRRYLNTFFDWCVVEEIILRNPCRKIEKIKTIKKEKKAFSDIEIEKMRNYLNNRNLKKLGRSNKGHEKEIKLRDIAIFETLLSSGVRVCELISINRSQVDQGQDEIIVLGKGKKERKVYLNAKARVAIEEYLKERKDDMECLFLSFDTFNKNTGRRISIAGIEEIVRRCGEKCEVEAYPHKFRRTCATMAVRKGMPIEQAQKMLGHSSLETTRIYVETCDNEVKISHEKYLN